MSLRFDVLIVGGGQAAAQLAVSLRQGGYEGSVAMVGEEPDPPYERPPLSKDYLAGTLAPERLALRPAGFWEARGVALLTGRRVIHVDPAARTVATTGGATIGYGSLVWAAGGHPRTLPVPGGNLAQVHAIRTRADVDRLRDDLAAASHVAVIGGGYIGLEATAILVKAGKRVTVLEAQDRVLARVAGEPVSRFYEAEHIAAGVDVRLGVGIESIVARDGRVAGVRLGSGEVVPAEVVIAGIGIVPSVGPLAQAGAETGNGVEVDDHCRTSLPDIYAIGDCACAPSRFAPAGRVRLESVQNAVDQAKTVAASLLGTPRPYDCVPWFWSNQYDLRLQTVGLSTGHDATVRRGTPSREGWSLVYLRAGRVVAIDCINAARDYVQGRALVDRGIEADPAVLADPSVPLKSLLPLREDA